MSDSDVVLELSADARLLGPVRALVRAYLSDLSFAQDRIGEIVLAIDEACANVIRHAYGGEPGHKYKLKLSRVDECVEFQVLDKGSGIDREVLTKAMDPPAPTLEDLTPGGLGISLIFEACDSVVYEPPSTMGNCVRMRVNLPDQAEPEQRAGNAG